MAMDRVDESWRGEPVFVDVETPFFGRVPVVGIVESVNDSHVTVRRAVYVNVSSETVGDPSSRQRESSYAVEGSEKLPRSAIVSIRRLGADEINRLLGLLQELRR